jgi:hypothetical protein
MPDLHNSTFKALTYYFVEVIRNENACKVCCFANKIVYIPSHFKTETLYQNVNEQSMGK